MNEYFLYLFLVIYFFKYSTAHTYIVIAKYLNTMSTLIWPDKGVSFKKLRGNVVQIKYHDGEKDCYLILPYSTPSKKWKKVTTVMKHPEKDEYASVDVTKLIMKLCGPGKDFYNIPLTPKQINRKWTTLTFHYSKRKGKTKSKTFEAGDIITF